MKRQPFIYLFIITFAGMFLPGNAWSAEKINVCVSILPQKYFVESIAGDLVNTIVIVDPGQSPADYEPSPSQMTMMSHADIYFAIGVAFESTWLKKFSDIHPDMKIVYTDAGIAKRPIDRHDGAEEKPMNHDHHRHDHGASDPHIWLSPPLVKVQAEHILNGLISVDPDNMLQYKTNYIKLITRIDTLDQELKTLFSNDFRRKNFLVFHPSWGYFADAYGLTQISIEIEGKTPKAREVKNLIEFSRQHQIQLIFVQPQFSTKHAEIIAKEINGRLIYADPLAEDWEKNLQTVAVSIKQALK